MSESKNVFKHNDLRTTYVKLWTYLLVLVPITLDYFFQETKVGRYTRVLVLVVITASVLINNRSFLRTRLQNPEIIFFTTALYIVGTFSSLTHGGTITPNVLSLIIFMLIVALNLDLYEEIFKSVVTCVQIIVSLSTLVILLKLNPRNYFASSVGYPVYFDSIGIPGRNYGILSHPNSLGQSACISILLILASKSNKLLLPLPVFCILKCGSRTAIVSTLVSLLLYYVIWIFKSRNKLTKINKSGSSFVLGSLIISIFLSSILQFVNYINVLDPNGLTQRVSIWQNTFTIFKSSPILGLGWGWEQRAIESSLLNIWATSAHNLILEMLFGSGIVGLLLFLLIVTEVLVYFGSLYAIEKMLITSILVFGVSEASIDLVYPTIQTFIFFLIALGINKNSVSK